MGCGVGEEHQQVIGGYEGGATEEKDSLCQVEDTVVTMMLLESRTSVLIGPLILLVLVHNEASPWRHTGEDSTHCLTSQRSVSPSDP